MTYAYSATQNNGKVSVDGDSWITALSTRIGLSCDLDPHRSQRVSESIREELEEIIGFELADPRVGSVTIAEVLVSPDSRRAHIRVLPLGSAAEQAATIEALNHAKSFLKQELTSRLQLYKTPDLHFESALPASLAARAPELLKRIRKGRPKS
jgi:ribosome-binding factor A